MLQLTDMKSFWNNLSQPFFILAPMEAVTDVVFRRVVARAGRPDIFFTEFANATGWVHAGDKAIAGRLIKEPFESPIVAQVWGGEPGDMEQFARHCAELGFDGIDINMGCPAKSAIKSGGAALIRRPDIAVASITAAKTASLPVSVKTRLGYTYVDEWRDWLRTILEQDIVNLTIHLRTKKEMSKVPAHFELIDEIVALRDEVAPQILLTINGDIRDRAHGLELAAQHPGVNGIMIGRGVFADPFCFAERTPITPLLNSSLASSPTKISISSSTSPPFSSGVHFSLKSPLEISSERSAEILNSSDFTAPVREGGRLDTTAGEPTPILSETPAQAREAAESESRRVEDCLSEASSADSPDLDDRASRRAEAVLEGSGVGDAETKSIREISVGEGANSGAVDERAETRIDYETRKLFDLLCYHLDLFDHYQPQTGRPFETLKRFFKIYAKGFDGAKELREHLMQAKSTDETRAIIANFLQKYYS